MGVCEIGANTPSTPDSVVLRNLCLSTIPFCYWALHIKLLSLHSLMAAGIIIPDVTRQWTSSSGIRTIRKQSGSRILLLLYSLAKRNSACTHCSPATVERQTGQQPIKRLCNHTQDKATLAVGPVAIVALLRLCARSGLLLPPYRNIVLVMTWGFKPN